MNNCLTPQERALSEKNFADTRRRINWVARVLSRPYVWDAFADARNALFDMAGSLDGKVVLDYGCGAGEVSLEILRRYRPAKLIAVDISEKWCQKAREQLAACESSCPVEVILCDAQHLAPLADNSIDVVLGTAILHHLDIGCAVSALHRILRPNGIACFAEPLGINPLFQTVRYLTRNTRSLYEHPLTGADFKVIRKGFELERAIYFNLFTTLAWLFAFLPSRRLFLSTQKALAALDRGCSRCLPWRSGLFLHGGFRFGKKEVCGQ